MSNTTKAELVANIAAKADLSKSDAGKALDATLSSISESLTRGHRVALPGFGAFEVRDRAARTGRNPQTGESIQIAASKVPAFKASSALKYTCNK